MSLRITIPIKTDEATPIINRLASVPRQRQALHRWMADAVHGLIRDHFAGLQASNPNKMGGRRTNFWNRMRGGTTREATEDAAIVSMPREVAQRYFGGTIVPTGGRKYLAIPARAEAYGRRPREFKDLVFIPPDHGRPAMLVKSFRTLLRDRNKGDKAADFRPLAPDIGGTFYFLVPKVTQRGDPAVLPTLLDIGARAISAANRFIARLIERRSA